MKVKSISGTLDEYLTTFSVAGDVISPSECSLRVKLYQDLKIEEEAQKLHKCATLLYTRWFKYDRDDLCVNKSQFVPVIFEPPCTLYVYCLSCYIAYIRDLEQNRFRVHHSGR